jgi:hypothetical protein
VLRRTPTIAPSEDARDPRSWRFDSRAGATAGLPDPIDALQSLVELLESAVARQTAREGLNARSRL